MNKIEILFDLLVDLPSFVDLQKIAGNKTELTDCPGRSTPGLTLLSSPPV